MVDEWDRFELERDRERLKELEENNIKGEMITMEKRVLVRLSKNYNVVEVEASNILEVDDFIQQKQWAFNEAVNLLNQIPDEGFSTEQREKRTASTYTKEVNPPSRNEPIPQQSYVTVGDIQTKMRLSDKQKTIAVSKINKGELTLQQVNSCRDYNEFNRVVFSR